MEIAESSLQSLVTVRLDQGRESGKKVHADLTGTTSCW